MMIPLTAVVVRRGITWREGSCPDVRHTTTKVPTKIRRWTLKAVGLGWGGLASIANRLGRMCKRLDSVGIKRKVIEVR